MLYIVQYTKSIDNGPLLRQKTVLYRGANISPLSTAPVDSNVAIASQLVQSHSRTVYKQLANSRMAVK